MIFVSLVYKSLGVCRSADSTPARGHMSGQAPLVFSDVGLENKALKILYAD